jgi:uncharacterized membrane protein YdjX (TVP38/TMEM64 family)
MSRERKETPASEMRGDRNLLGERRTPSKKTHWRSPFLWIGVALVALCLPLVFRAIPALFEQLRLVIKPETLGPWAAVLFVGLQTVATTIGFPAVMLTILGGFWFGLWWGSLWSALGATLGAVSAFFLTRSLLHDWIHHRFEHHPLLAKFDQATAQNPLSFVLTVRFVPISPFTAMNFLFGLTKISGRVYTFGTFLGILPWVVTYTWVGTAGQQTLRGGSPIPLAIAGCILAIVSALPFLRRQR